MLGSNGNKGTSEPRPRPELPPLRTWNVMRYNSQTDTYDQVEVHAHSLEHIDGGGIAFQRASVYPNGAVLCQYVRGFNRDRWYDYEEVTIQNEPSVAPSLLVQ